jgi:hypothetical protein
MSEQLLYENSIKLMEDTNVTDIARQAPKASPLSRNIIGLSLPALISFVQPLNSPEGLVFGLSHRGDTQIVSTVNDTNDDIIILRKLIQTQTREVILDLTNEAIEDINSLFGNNFPEIIRNFLENGGEIYNDGNDNGIDNFFLSVAQNRALQKTNNSFMTWMQSEATNLGGVNIATYDDMSRIFGAIGELREGLYKRTHKIGKPWLLVSPRIAGFLSSTVGSTMNNGSLAYNLGQKDPNNTINPYVMTMGDIEVYQYDPNTRLAGGTSNTTETTGTMYMGYYGNQNSASIFYHPYKEYFVKGGDDYGTGQSNVFYRIRDTWHTNPLDTYDKAIDNTIIENSTANPIGTNSSQYIVTCDITFGENLIQ